MLRKAALLAIPIEAVLAFSAIVLDQYDNGIGFTLHLPGVLIVRGCLALFGFQKPTEWMAYALVFAANFGVVLACCDGFMFLRRRRARGALKVLLSVIVIALALGALCAFFFLITEYDLPHRSPGPAHYSRAFKLWCPVASFAQSEHDWDVGRVHPSHAAGIELAAINALTYGLVATLLGLAAAVRYVVLRKPVKKTQPALAARGQRHPAGGEATKPGGKRVILRPMAVLVIVVGLMVVAFLPLEDLREAKARRLIAELREPSGFRKWLIESEVAQPFRGRAEEAITSELAALGEPAVPVCLRALRDDNSVVRWTALLAMSRMHPVRREAVDALIEAMNDEGIWVHITIRRELCRIGAPAVPALVEALKDERWLVRKGAAMALGELRREATGCAPALLQALKDERSEVRAAAAEALGQIDAPADEVVPALVRALQDEERSVRFQAGKALALLGRPEEGVPVLILDLEHEEAYLRRRAASALGEIGPAAEAAVPSLEKALKDDNEHVRQAAAVALGRIGPAAKEAVPALEEALKDKDEEISVRSAAGAALAKLGFPDRVVPVLIAALEEESPHLREYAATTLSEIGPPAKAAVPALKEALEDKAWYVRKAAAEALGNMGPAAREAVPALEKALKDELENVRVAAGAALAKLGLPQRAVPVLIAEMEDESGSCRSYAAWTLGEIGAAAKPAVPALKEALEDKVWYVRHAAAEALKKIQAAPTTRKGND